MAKKNKNYKARIREDILAKIARCKTYSEGMRLIHQGMRNKVLDLGDGVELKKTLPPRPTVIIKDLNPKGDILFGVVMKSSGLIQIKLKKEGDSWINGDISVKKIGILTLPDNSTIYVTDDQEHADIWESGAKLAITMICKNMRETIK